MCLLSLKPGGFFPSGFCRTFLVVLAIRFVAMRFVVVAINVCPRKNRCFVVVAGRLLV